MNLILQLLVLSSISDHVCEICTISVDLGRPLGHLKDICDTHVVCRCSLCEGGDHV